MLYYQLLLSDFFFLLALYSGCIGIIQFYKLVALFIKKKVCVNILHLLGNLEICSTSVSLCLSFRNP